MRILSRRVEKLENRVSRERYWDLGRYGVPEVARTKLSEGERALLDEAFGNMSDPNFDIEYGAIWERWDQALREATKETGCPIFIGATERMY
jgi:hypothetical protein